MDRIRDLKIELTPISGLTSYPGNAHTHSAKQIRQIAASIEAFGWTNPLIVNEVGMIMAGAGRYAAAKLLGLDHVPVIRIGELSQAQLRAYVVGDNRLVECAGWDQELLRLEFQGLLELELDFDIGVTGFETAEIDLLLADDTHEAGDEPDWQPPVTPVMPAVTQNGDLWIIDEHRLLCADATQESSYQRLLGGAQAALIFTDPPYNIRIDSIISKGAAKHREFAMASGEMSETEFVNFLKRSLGLCAAHSKDGAVHYVCMDWRHAAALHMAGRDVYSDLLNICVWAKSNGGMGSLYRSQHELVFVFKNGTAPHINNIELGRFGRNRTNVWSYPGANVFGPARTQALAAHPTVKPVELVKDAILDCSSRGDIVLDAFLGSGTTLVAAHRASRRGYALEIDPLYADVAIRRFRALTGIEPIHTGSGLTLAQLESQKSDT